MEISFRVSDVSISVCDMKYYIYEGPVLQFGKVVDQRWHGVTYAVSEKKARNNLTFRYKREHGLVPGANITLPGEFKEIEEL